MIRSIEEVSSVIKPMDKRDDIIRKPSNQNIDFHQDEGILPYFYQTPLPSYMYYDVSGKTRLLLDLNNPSLT